MAARRSTLNAHYTDPAIATAIWDLCATLGFDGGTVLEPGCGAGAFLALAPAGCALVGVEVDPATAGIAQLLHPHADIRAEGFEDARLLAGSFDLAIGNVPFGKVALHDPVHNRHRHSIHNHFIIKALHLVRPGGLVAVLTSRYTLDARSPAARRDIAELADLAGALRLPNTAHRASAGTDVVTDLLVLRRRIPDQRERHAGDWLDTAIVDLDGHDLRINRWFSERPDQVVGTLGATGGVYRADDLTVTPPAGDLTAAITTAVERLAAVARNAGLGWQPRPSSAPATRIATASPQAKEGSLVRDGAGFARIVNGTRQPHEPAKSDVAELALLLELRDSTQEILAAQAASLDDTAFAVAQAQLNDRYDTYLARFGPLNRFRLARTGRTDPDTGADRYRRLFPRMGGFGTDPDYWTVLALEHHDPDVGTTTKADIFTTRVVAPRIAPAGADTAAEALAISLDRSGSARLDTVADLLGCDPVTARAELATLVYDDPATGELTPASQYLSGDVRAKLATAICAAGDDDRYAINVEALTAVQPPDLLPGEIDARLGAPWIEVADIEAFARDTLAAPSVEIEHAPVTATWAVTCDTWHRRTVAATSEWGTARADAVGLLEASLNQRAATVWDIDGDGTRTVNPAETLAAREKQDTLERRFATWVWEDPDRALRLAGIYNQRFNAVVLPAYDGAHLSFPGLADSFTPHPHQRDAAWRIVASGTDTLLAHAVGAGKTATMVLAGIELRRLGLVRRPAYVVPNHMLGQFTREFLQLYPAARVLVATREDASPGGRKRFVARCATGDFDAVICTHSSFERIPLSRATRSAYLGERIDTFRAAALESAGGKGLTVKRLEAAAARLESRHQALQAEQSKDDGATFEEAGVDFVFVDEAHLFKNKAFPTRIQGAGGSGSRRAEDLDVKLWWLRRTNGPRVACFATATPIANSVAEMYVMQSYLQPDVLAAAGIEAFDAWAATFGATVTALELAPDGGSYRLTTRFARFRNVPELLTMYRQAADARTAGQLDLPVPALAGGKPETVIVEPSDTLRDYVTGLVDRAQQVRNRAVTPEEDNMLKVTGDGRRAALDLRLVDRAPDPAGGKIAVAADRVAAIWAATRENRYVDPAGRQHPRPGALQFVFCDLGTPRQGQWNVYDELRHQLVARGIPVDVIRYVHDATNDRAKADLFAACRDGRVAVLIGSTEKMGVGTNAQTRAVALHHLDCPWRPADLEQREGRLLRQGNQNSEVSILRYATEGSFDVFMWQTVERKAAFIAQVTAGNPGARDLDDIGDQALSYAEVKALATGNPAIMEKAGVDAEIAKLQRLRSAHHRDQHALGGTHASALARADRHDRAAARIEAALARRVDTRGDRFAMTVIGTRHTGRADAGNALRTELARQHRQPDASPVTLGELGGLDVRLTATGHDQITIALDDVAAIDVSVSELAGTDPARLVGRLEHRLHRLGRDLDDARGAASEARSEADRAGRRLGSPFDLQPRLDTLLDRQAELERHLSEVPDPTATSPPGHPPTPSARLAALTVATGSTAVRR